MPPHQENYNVCERIEAETAQDDQDRLSTMLAEENQGMVLQDTPASSRH